MQQPLPELPARFAEKKSRILAQLSVPDSDYTDASPKGSVDEGIRELLDELNAAPGFVTTSSCAGRLSAFLEGRKTVGNGQVAGVGGKGAGGTWLYVSHEPVRAGDQALAAALTLAPTVEHPGEAGHAAADYRLIHLKFEPMILHVLTASHAHAQLLLRCALQAGFRESGAINLVSTSTGSPTPMVAVRSTGLALESVVGFETGDGQRWGIVSGSYVQTLTAIANERFRENSKRIARLQMAFREAVGGSGLETNLKGIVWEDAEMRKERKRVEGLKRRAQLAAQRSADADSTINGTGDAG